MKNSYWKAKSPWGIEFNPYFSTSRVWKSSLFLWNFKTPNQSPPSSPKLLQKRCQTPTDIAMAWASDGREQSFQWKFKFLTKFSSKIVFVGNSDGNFNGNPSDTIGIQRNFCPRHIFQNILDLDFYVWRGHGFRSFEPWRERKRATKREREREGEQGRERKRKIFTVFGGRWPEKSVVVAYNLTVNHLF